MKQLITLLCFLTIIFGSTSFSYAETEKGKFFGAKETEYPSWFKNSFLDLKEDVAEAAQEGKRLLIFFHQDGCPYCNALVDRNLAQKDIQEKVRKHFDVVSINMWGDREVIDFDGTTYSEKTFAAKMRVQFTPTLVFFNESQEVVLRLNGYRSPDRFTHDLDYVALKKEKEFSYRDYIKANFKENSSSKKLHSENFFSANFDLTRKGKKPVAVFFEQKDCPNCDILHTKVLPDKTTQDIIAKFDVVQLDMWSTTPVTTPKGKKTTAKTWAKEINIQFAPSIVIFNELGEEIIRSEAFFKNFHTQSIFDYVLSGAYKKEPSFQRYLSERAEHLRESGKNVDIWRFADEAPGERK
ncbi:MAG: thioredoxin fold domain-containing protein [Gammaproteobacteria bacterium]|nr:thioredoxin fold domain-containing protein [Gammaproteobacteria bacterium]